MNKKPGSASKASAEMSREERLKAALKANLQRRKAQMRARKAGDTADSKA